MGETLAITVANSESMVDFFCVKIHSNKKTQAKIKLPETLRTNNSYLRKSYHVSPRDTHSLVGQIQSHLSKIKEALHVYIYILIS